MVMERNWGFVHVVVAKVFTKSPASTSGAVAADYIAYLYRDRTSDRVCEKWH
jgi:hypothetical protein